MRTTVDIDARLLQRLRDEAHRSGVSFKELLNRTLRQGLEASRETAEPYVLPTFAMGRPRVALVKALAVAAELEEEEIARELALRK